MTAKARKRRRKAAKARSRRRAVLVAMTDDRFLAGLLEILERHQRDRDIDEWDRHEQIRADRIAEEV